MSAGTGFTPTQVDGILMREGTICAMSGAELPDGTTLPRHKATTANHRLNRGAGGTADRGTGRNGTDNGCAICWTCNGLIEDGAELADIARHRGVKLTAGDRPHLVAFWCIFYGQWVQLIGDDMILLGLTDPTTRPELHDPEELELGI